MEQEFWANKYYLSSYLIVVFITVLILVFQGSFLAFTLTGNIRPDLLLILVICLAFLWGEERGVVVGFIAGIFQDIFYGPALGFYTLSMLLPAYLAGLGSRVIYTDQVIGPLLAVFLGTILHEAVSFFLVELFWGNEFPLSYYMETMFLPVAAYNLVLTILIYPLLFRAEQAKLFYPSFK